MRPKGLSELCLLSFPPLGIAFTVFYKFVCLEERRSTSVAVGNMKIFALYIWREASIPLEVDGAEYYSKATKNCWRLQTKPTNSTNSTADRINTAINTITNTFTINTTRNTRNFFLKY